LDIKIKENKILRDKLEEIKSRKWLKTTTITTTTIKRIRIKLDTKIKWNKYSWIKLKKKLHKILKSTQIAIKLMKIKIEINTNWWTQLNFERVGVSLNVKTKKKGRKKSYTAIKPLRLPPHSLPY
jgi:hypothetical protein